MTALCEKLMMEVFEHEIKVITSLQNPQKDHKGRLTSPLLVTVADFSFFFAIQTLNYFDIYYDFVKVVTKMYFLLLVLRMSR